MQAQPPAQAQPGGNIDDEIIPTAIVIKNIPFNVKKETLLDIIVRVYCVADLCVCALIIGVRLRSPSRRRMRSITILMLRALSVDLPLLISDRHRTPMRS